MPGIDETDFKILQALSENSRVSLKKLAQSLRLKTNRLQYRIDKLVDQGFISSYTSIINPDSVGLNKLIFARIISSSQNTKRSGESSAKFLEDLATIILKDFDEIMFASVGYDELNEENMLIMIFAFYDAEHQASVFDAIKENPLVNDIHTTNLAVAGINHRLFTFTPELLDKKDTKLRKKMIKAEKEHQKHALDREDEEESDDEPGDEDTEEVFPLDKAEDFEEISALVLKDDEKNDLDNGDGEEEKDEITF